jgi:hypothetical protein
VIGQPTALTMYDQPKLESTIRLHKVHEFRCIHSETRIAEKERDGPLD